MPKFSFSYLLIIATFVSMALGQHGAISKSEGNNLYLFDLVLGFTAIFNLVYLIGFRKSFVVPMAFFYFSGFLVAGVLSLFINSPRYQISELPTALFYSFRFGFYLLFVLGTYNLVRLKTFMAESIYRPILLFGAVIVIAGFIQLALLPDFTVLDTDLGWDPHKNRMASTFFDPNYLGAYFVLLLLIKVAGLKKGKTGLFASGFLPVLFVSAIFLTFSRSTWLMLAVVVFLLGLIKRPKLLLLAFAISFVAYHTVPRVQTRISGATDPADSARLRFISWGNTIEIIMDNPVIGVGLNGMRSVQKEYGFTDYDTYLGHSYAGSDSSLLFIFATTGVIGLGLFLAGLLEPLKRLKLKNKFNQPILIYLIAMTALLVESQFINSLFYPQILVLWLLLLAFSYL